MACAPDAGDLIRAFLEGRNPQTLRAYSQDMEAFRTWLGAADVDAAAHRLLDHGHGQANMLALGYRAHMTDSRLSAATINRRLASLRSLVKLAGTLGLVPWKLEVANLKAQAYRDTRGPGRAGFKKLLAALDARSDAKGIRDRAILRLLYDLALRRAEVCRLDLADVDLEGGRLAVLGKGRTGKELLTLPDKTAESLREWITVRGNGQGALFTTCHRGKKGKRLTGDGLCYLVKKLGNKCKLRVRPHGLRHSSITRLLDLSKGNVRKVQRFSRHKDLRTLNVYDDNRADVAGEMAKLVSDDA